MRPWIVLCTVLLLGGCNMVHSDHPLFTAADAVGAPTFRGGVWAAPEPGCDFDPNLPVKQWPHCANGESMRNAEVGTTMLVAAGKPLIVQVTSNGTDDGAKAPPDYFFVALDPVRLDGAGQIVAMHSWPIECGPPRRQSRHSKGPRGTLHPWPGMRMDPDGNNCTPASTAAIRAAALLSRPIGPAPNGAYWVRDGEQ
jgi:hypothetical protein